MELAQQEGYDSLPRTLQRESTTCVLAAWRRLRRLAHKTGPRPGVRKAARRRCPFLRSACCLDKQVGLILSDSDGTRDRGRQGWPCVRCGQSPPDLSVEAISAPTVVARLPRIVCRGNEHLRVETSLVSSAENAPIETLTHAWVTSYRDYIGTTLLTPSARTLSK